MSIIGSTMIMKAINQQKSTQIQQEIFQLRGISDAVFTRFKHFFLQHPSSYFLSFDLKKWTEHINDYEARLCRSNQEYNPIVQQILSFSKQEKVKIEDQKFFVSDFTHITENNALLTATIESANGATSNVQIDIFWEFVYINSDKKVPALWINKGDLSRTQFYGDVWFTNPDCDYILDNIMILNESLYQAKYVPYSFPNLLDINDVKDNLDSYNQVTLDNSFDETNITLPRQEEKSTRTEGIYQYYEYILSNVKSKSINIETRPNSIVILHIEGDVTETNITHTCGSSKKCPAQNLIILGHGNSEFCFVFDELNALIVAPNGQVGIKSKTPYQPATVTGSVWTKNLDTTGSCGNKKLHFVQSLTFQNMPRELQILLKYPKTYILFKSTAETVKSQDQQPLPPPDIIPPAPMIPISIEPSLKNFYK